MDLIAKFKKKYGTSYLEEVPAVSKVSTGLLGLDQILEGGMPRGRIIEIAALPSAGKSTIALFLCKHFQTSLDWSVAYIDMERTVDLARVTSLGVTVNDSFHYCRPTSGKESLEMAMDLMLLGVNFVVIDSVGYLGGGEVEDGTIGTMQIASTARLLSQVQPQLVQVVESTDSIVLFINQLRSKISLYGGMNSSGGIALQYMTSISMRLKREESLNDGSGNAVMLTLSKNKLGKEGLSTRLYLLDDGLCPYSSAADFLNQANLITRRGAWYFWTDDLAQFLELDPKIGQGLKAVVDFLRDNPHLITKLQAYKPPSD